MPVVATWDWSNRRIIMGVANYDPIDIYREHRALRRDDETTRKYKPMVRAIGGLPKGGGQRFGNALQTLDGAKIVPLNGSGVNNLQGEIVTDNPDVDADPFDSSGLSNPPRIVTSPISVILEKEISGAGSIPSADKQEIIEGVNNEQRRYWQGNERRTATTYQRTDKDTGDVLVSKQYTNDGNGNETLTEP